MSSTIPPKNKIVKQAQKIAENFTLRTTSKNAEPASKSVRNDDTMLPIKSNLNDQSSNDGNSTKQGDDLQTLATDAGTITNISKISNEEVSRILANSELLEAIMAKAKERRAIDVKEVGFKSQTDDGTIAKEVTSVGNETKTVEKLSSSVLEMRQKSAALAIGKNNRLPFGEVFISNPPQTENVLTNVVNPNWRTQKIKITSEDPTVLSIVPAFLQVPVNLEDETLMLKLRDEHLESRTIEDISELKSGSDEVFNGNVAYVICEPNPEFVKGSNIKMECGVPMTKSIFKSFTSIQAVPHISVDKFSLVSGYLAWALNFARKTGVVLKYGKSGEAKTNVVTFHTNFLPTNLLSTVLGKKIIMPMYPSLVLATISRTLPFLDHVAREIIEDAPYRIGEIRVIRRCNPIAKDLVVVQAINIDTPTATALNRTCRAYLDENFAAEVIEPVLSAYSMSHVQTTVLNSWPELKFGRTPHPDFELSGLIIAAAGTTSLFESILTINEQAFLQLGTVSPALSTPTLDHIPNSKLDPVLLSVVKTRMSESNFQDAIRCLVLQVTPQLIFPTVIPELYCVRDAQLVFALFEILMMFTFTPSVAKLAGAGIARTLKSIISLLWNTEFQNFLQACGWINNQPGNGADATDVEYWANENIPTIFMPNVLIPHNCPAITQIYAFLRPLVEPVPHIKATVARFPRLTQNPVTWLPCPPVAPMTAETSPFKLRINAIVETCKQWIETTNVNAEKGYKAKATYLFEAINGAMICHGLGMSREVGKVLRWMVNRKTFFVDFYDGDLGTLFPNQMVLAARDNLTYPDKVDVEMRAYREFVVRPQMIWSIIFGFDFKGAHYDPILHDSNQCTFNAPNPGDHLSNDNALIEACTNLLEPFALTNMIISDDINVGGMEVLRELIGNDRLLSRDYAAIREFVTSSLKGSTFETEYVRFKDLENVHMTWKIPHPQLRYVNRLGQVMVLEQGDPVIMSQGMSLLRDDFLHRFNVGIEAIASPRSVYSRLRKGLIIQRTTLSLDNPYLEEPLPFLPVEDGYNRTDHTVLHRAEHGRFFAYQVEGQIYEEGKDFPNRTFILRDFSSMDEASISILVEGVFAGKFRIELPDVYYLFELKHCSRNSVGYKSEDIRKLLTLADGEIPKITFYDTELPSFLYLSQRVQSRRSQRYIYPMQSVTDHVIARGLFCEEDQPDERYWKEIPQHLCDTGTINDFGIQIYRNGNPKTFSSLCFSNNVIVMGQETDFSGEVYYDEKLVRHLE